MLIGCRRWALGPAGDLRFLGRLFGFVMCLLGSALLMEISICGKKKKTSPLFIYFVYFLYSFFF